LITAYDFTNDGGYLYGCGDTEVTTSIPGFFKIRTIDGAQDFLYTIAFGTLLTGATTAM
jgi:hypothetical protein